LPLKHDLNLPNCHYKVNVLVWVSEGAILSVAVLMFLNLIIEFLRRLLAEIERKITKVRIKF
jgi:hypothetical protein